MMTMTALTTKDSMPADDLGAEFVEAKEKMKDQMPAQDHGGKSAKAPTSTNVTVPVNEHDVKCDKAPKPETATLPIQEYTKSIENLSDKSDAMPVKEHELQCVQEHKLQSVEDANPTHGQSGRDGDEILLRPGRRNSQSCFCNGEVLEMFSRYGWLKIRGKVEHPAIGKNSGHVYVNKRDVQEGSKDLANGDCVAFYLYVDAIGLSAESCHVVQPAAKIVDDDGTDSATILDAESTAPSSSLTLRADAIDGAYMAQGSGVTLTFRDGDEVEFWSKSEETWLRGHFNKKQKMDEQSAEEKSRMSVKVEFDGIPKWFAPADFKSTVRHYVRCEAPWNPKAFSPCLVRALRERFYVQAGLGGRPCWAARTQLCADDLSKLWLAAEEEEGRRQLTTQETQYIYRKAQALLTEIGVMHESDVKATVDVHELMHHALMLLHPPGPATSKILSLEMESPGPTARLPRIVSRWAVMDEEGCGLISPSDLERALKKESRLIRQDEVATARAMICEVDPGGSRQAASYSEFLACCLGVNYSDVCLHWYDMSNDWVKYLSPLLGSWEGGLWHTSISVFEREYFLNGGHISWTASGTMFCGRPARAQKLGITTRTLDELREYVFMELDPQFNEQTYDVLENNGNHFVDKIAQFLLGQGIPDEVRVQPQRLMSAPTAWMLKPLMNQWVEEGTPSGGITKDVPFKSKWQHDSTDTSKDGSTSTGTPSDDDPKIAIKDGSTSAGTPSDDDAKLGSKDGSTSAGTPSEDDPKVTISSGSTSPLVTSDSEGEFARWMREPALPMTTMRIKVNDPACTDKASTAIRECYHRVCVHIVV